MLNIFAELADWVVIDLIGLDKASHLGGSVHFFIEDITKIFVLLTIMIYVIAFIRAGFPAERVRDFLAGRNRVFGYAAAAVFGAITPFCSCSSIPLFMGFVAARIPIGITMSFLITSPMVNEAAVAMLGGMLGWKLTAIYVIFGMGAGVIGGFFFDFIKAEKWLSYKPAGKNCCCSCTDSSSAGEKPEMTWKYRNSFACDELKDILKRIWIWVVIGILIGAALHGYVPASFISDHLGGGQWWTVPLAVIIGIPTYANATGVIPVIGALISKGMPVGTAFAFMLSTAAASLPEFIMLKQVMKTKLLVVFALYLLVFFTLCGWVLNIFYK